MTLLRLGAALAFMVASCDAEERKIIKRRSGAIVGAIRSGSFGGQLLAEIAAGAGAEPELQWHLGVPIAVAVYWLSMRSSAPSVG